MGLTVAVSNDCGHHRCSNLACGIATPAVMVPIGEVSCPTGPSSLSVRMSSWSQLCAVGARDVCEGAAGAPG